MGRNGNCNDYMNAPATRSVMTSIGRPCKYMNTSALHYSALCRTQFFWLGKKSFISAGARGVA